MNWTPCLDDCDDDFSNLELSDKINKEHNDRSTLSRIPTETNIEPCKEIQCVESSTESECGHSSRTSELMGSLQYALGNSVEVSTNNNGFSGGRTIPCHSKYFQFKQESENEFSHLPIQKIDDFSTIFDDADNRESEKDSLELSEKQDQERLNAEFYRGLGNPTGKNHSTEPEPLPDSSFAIKLRVRLD